MRDSLALLDQASILGIEKQITKETIESLIGKLTFDVLYDLTGKILDKEIEASIQDVENIYEKGSEPRNFVENYIEFLRNVILVLSSKNAKNVSDFTLISNENIEKIKNDKRFELEKLIRILDKVIEFYKEIKVSTNPYLWAELMVISVSGIDAKEEIKPSAAPASAPVIKNIQPVVSAIQASAMQAPIQPAAQAPTQSSMQAPAPKAATNPAASDIQAAPAQTPAVSVASAADTTVPAASAAVSKPAITPAAPDVTPVAANAAPAVTPLAAQSPEEQAKLWSEILNKVESIPAKFFYSGVGKLSGIKDGHITLGFVNENALMQAKSDNKYKPLLKAIQAVLGEKGGIEFVTVNENTKIIDTKINVKISQSQPAQAPKPAAQNNFATGGGEHSSQNYEKKEEKSFKKQEPDENEQIDTSSYTRVTKEMLEAYSGRVVE